MSWTTTQSNIANSSYLRGFIVGVKCLAPTPAPRHRGCHRMDGDGL